MISGTDVTVTRRTVAGRDEMGEPEWTHESETVRNVLVGAPTTDDMDETNRMYGVTCDLVLHFPKTYTASLKGCTVGVYGGEYRVLGDPQPYMEANTPTPWNRPAKVVRADG